MSDYTILVVDYEPRSIQTIRDALEKVGYRVEVASDGASALEVFKRTHPMLTLIEVMLPKRSGLEVCRELKETDHGAKTPVVVMTSRFRSRTYRTQARYEFNADDFLEKPLNEDRVRVYVHNMLASTQKRPCDAHKKIVDLLDGGLSGAQATAAPEAAPEGRHGLEGEPPS